MAFTQVASLIYIEGSFELLTHPLKSKNAHGLSQMQRSLLHGFVFWFFLFDLSFDFLFDCTLQDKKDFRRILQVRVHLLCREIYMFARLNIPTWQSLSQQPQAVTLANPFIIPLHQKNKGQKNPWSKTPCASVIIRERFFDLRSVAAGSQNELLQVFSIFL